MESNNTYIEKTFENLELLERKIENSNFEKVVFEFCNFQETEFLNCSFIDCTFKDCNLSLFKAKRTSFIDINFIGCKIIGVNWEEIKGNMGISLSFEGCILNYSSFVEVNFFKSKILNCEAKEVNFFKSNLAKCDCRDSDFQGSIFSNTNLQESDFRGAKNYFIDIFENRKNLKGAKFSTVEVERLLSPLEIIIE